MGDAVKMMAFGAAVTKDAMNVKNTHDQTVLHILEERNKTELVRLLLADERFVEHDATDWQGQSALHIAASLGNLDMCRALLSSVGFNVASAQKTDDSWTALEVAASQGCLEVFRCLLGDDSLATHLNIPKKSGRTALHIAAGRGHVQISSFVLGLASSATVNLADNGGRTVLHWACENGHAQVANLVLGHPKFISHDAQNIHGFTALHRCAANGNLELCQMLVRSDFFNAVCAKDVYGFTALERASERGQNRVVELLAAEAPPPQLPAREFVAHVHVCTNVEQSPLHDLNLIGDDVPVEITERSCAHGVHDVSPSPSLHSQASGRELVHCCSSETFVCSEFSFESDGFAG